MKNLTARGGWAAAMALAGGVLLLGCGGQQAGPAQSGSAGSGPASVSASPVASPSRAAAPSTETTAGSPQASASSSKPLDTVNYVGVANNSALGPLALADAYGYFKQQRLAVTITNINNDADVLTAIASGTADVGNTTYSAGFFNAVGRGTGIRMAAASTTITPGHSNGGIVIRPDLKDKVKEVKDVKGMQFGICSPNSGCEFLAEQFLAKGGLKPSDVTYVTLGFPDIAPAMANKAIDIGILIDPLFTASIEKGLVAPLMHGGDIYPSGYTASGFWYSEQFRTKRTDVAQRFTVALVQGMRDWVDALIYKGPKRQSVIQVLTERTPLKDPALYDKLDLPSMDPTGYGNPIAIQMNLDWLQKKGLLSKPVTVSDTWDPSFLDFANAKLGPYKPPA